MPKYDLENLEKTLKNEGKFGENPEYVPKCRTQEDQLYVNYQNPKTTKIQVNKTYLLMTKAKIVLLVSTVCFVVLKSQYFSAFFAINMKLNQKL